MYAELTPILLAPAFNSIGSINNHSKFIFFNRSDNNRSSITKSSHFILVAIIFVVVVESLDDWHTFLGESSDRIQIKSVHQ